MLFSNALFLFRSSSRPSFFRKIRFFTFQFRRIVLKKLTPVARFVILYEVMLCASAAPRSIIGKAMALRTCAACSLSAVRFATGTTPVTLFFGVVATHIAPLVSSSVDGTHHLLCIAFRHFDVRKLAQQVDMSYLLAAMYMPIEKLHHFSGIKSIVFSKIDKQSAVT